MIGRHVNIVRVSRLVNFPTDAAGVDHAMGHVLDLDMVVHVGRLGHVVAQLTHPPALTHVGHLGSDLGIQV